MKKIMLFSLFLLMGLVLSQVLPLFIHSAQYERLAHVTKLLTTVALGFIMIRVGYEFELDKSRLGLYGWDYVVAATAATIPWILVALYFVFVLSGDNGTTLWKEALLTSRFASPTSAGVLFSMLAAAGLAGTWMYRKIKILAIFDDLDTVILMIPLEMLILGLKWQLLVVLVPMIIFLLAAWHFLHNLKIPVTWPWVLGYSVIITIAAEGIYHTSKLIDEVVPIHIEVLLPAFAIGCMMAHRIIPSKSGQKAINIIEKPSELLVTVIISTIFMALVGLSMPPLANIAGPAPMIEQMDREVASAYTTLTPEHKVKKEVTKIRGGLSSEPGGSTASWPVIALHVILVTILSNIGKLFPFFCYKEMAHWKERLALAIGMFPRGEVGAGVLIISISYGIGGTMMTVAMLSLALNLMLTGVFLIAVKKLLHSEGVLEAQKNRLKAE